MKSISVFTDLSWNFYFFSTFCIFCFFASSLLWRCKFPFFALVMKKMLKTEQKMFLDKIFSFIRIKVE